MSYGHEWHPNGGKRKKRPISVGPSNTRIERILKSERQKTRWRRARERKQKAKQETQAMKNESYDPMQRAAANDQAFLTGASPQTPAKAEKPASVDLTRFQTTCRKCPAVIVFVHNLDTGKEGPVDLRPTIYVYGNAGGRLEGWTFPKFIEHIESVLLKDGRIIPAEGLHASISHFQTCPAAQHFSGRNK